MCPDASSAFAVRSCRAVRRLYVEGMDHIPPPTLPFGDPDRHLMCQMAVELAVQDVIEAAVRAGWEEAETLSAIVEVADNLMLAAGADAELDALMQTIKGDRT